MFITPVKTSQTALAANKQCNHLCCKYPYFSGWNSIFSGIVTTVHRCKYWLFETNVICTVLVPDDLCTDCCHTVISIKWKGPVNSWPIALFGSAWSMASPQWARLHYRWDKHPAADWILISNRTHTDYTNTQHTHTFIYCMTVIVLLYFLSINGILCEHWMVMPFSTLSWTTLERKKEG